jgi:type I restriction enzyme S subunit
MAQLQDFASIVMGQSPKGENCYNLPQGLPLLNGPTEFGSHNPKPTQWTDDPKRMASPGDLLFCVRGSTTGRMNWADQEYAIGRGLAAIRHKYGLEFQPWVRGVIEFQLSELLAAATGSTFPNVTRDQLNSLLIPQHSNDQQREIASILGALDDKIELNRCMSATLEEMARSLYRSWFVDFDPVHAKMEDRQPAFMDEATAALFPDRFGENGLPEGWRMRRLGDVLTLNYGKALKKDIRIPGQFAVYGSGGTNSTHTDALVHGPTIIVGRKGTVGSLYWEPHGCWPIDTTFYVTTAFPWVYVLKALETLPLSKMNTDAAVPGLNRENVYRLEIPFPGTKVIGAFTEITGKWRERADSLKDENVTLSSLRDSLLPKLMSGELRVGEARDQIEEVA